MKKTEKAALLLQSFPEIPKADLLECQRLAPHFMLYRSDLSSARCGACGKTLTDYDYDDFLFVLEHKKDIVCPECGRKVTAVCDKYRYSVEVERYAQNFVIFQAGENGTCYAHCVRIQVNLHKEIGEPAQEVARYEETQRYAFADGQCYRFGRDRVNQLIPIYPGSDSFYARTGLSEWKYRTRMTEPTWDQPGMGYFQDKTYTILDDAKPLKGTCLQYAEIDKLDQIPMFEYIKFYMKHPNIEYIIKLGYTDMVRHWFAGYCAGVPGWIDWKQNDVRRMLGMDSYELRETKAREITPEDWHMIRENMPGFTVNECLKYAHLIRSCWGTLEGCAGKSTEDKRRVLKYLHRQNRGTHRQMYLSDYSDYLRECRELHYDLNDPVIRFPRDLAAAHERTAEALRAIQAERAAIAEAKRLKQRLRDAKKLDKELRKLKLLRDRLCFQYEDLLIRAPESAVEIVQEGAALHHCVGGYAERHAKGALHIMFIRTAEKPDVPYYTMEISTEGQIVQVRGLRNCNPTAAVKALIAAYTEYLAGIFGKQQKARKTA